MLSGKSNTKLHSSKRLNGNSLIKGVKPDTFKRMIAKHVGGELAGDRTPQKIKFYPTETSVFKWGVPGGFFDGLPNTTIELKSTYYDYKTVAKYSHYVTAFANKSLGGGVLGHGAVQEELMYLCALPEIADAIAARVYTKGSSYTIPDYGSIVIRGAKIICPIKHLAERDFYQSKGVNYNNFKTRYGKNWDNVFDNYSNSGLKTNVIAVDAYRHKSKKTSLDSYNVSELRRLFQKLYAGYTEANNLASKPATIHTGLLGCGDYKNDELTMLSLQYLAAQKAGVQKIVFWLGSYKGSIKDIKKQAIKIAKKIK